MKRGQVKPRRKGVTRRPRKTRAKGARPKYRVGGAASRPGRVPTRRVVAGVPRLMRVSGEGPRTISETIAISIPKATTAAAYYVKPNSFARVITKHLAMYERAELMGISVRYYNLIATGRDGVLFMLWDYNGTRIPNTMDNVLVHRCKRQVVLWQSSPSINIPVPPIFRRPIDTKRITTDNTFAPTGEQDVAIGWFHNGIDGSAPTYIGYVTCTITVRLHEMSAVPTGEGINATVPGAQMAMMVPEGGDAALPKVSEPSPGIAMSQEPVEVAPSTWVPEDGVQPEGVVVRTFRPPTGFPLQTRPVPAGPAMNVARAKKNQVGPAAAAASEQ